MALNCPVTRKGLQGSMFIREKNYGKSKLKNYEMPHLWCKLKGKEQY
jgi:hypothetical protein